MERDKTVQLDPKQNCIKYPKVKLGKNRTFEAINPQVLRYLKRNFAKNNQIEGKQKVNAYSMYYAQ